MLYYRIKNNITEAIKSKDSTKRDCLKNVMGKARLVVKEKFPKEDMEEIPNDIMLDAIQKEVKQLNQTITALENRQDTDLYKLSVVQLNILNEYLPRQMTREEIEKEVIDILSNGEYNNFGQKMKACMTKLKGRADSKIIKEIIENHS